MDIPEPVNLNVWQPESPEPGGQEGKDWYRNAQGESWLFKPVVLKQLKPSKEKMAAGSEPELLRMGDDWAEQLACSLAKLLNLPSVVTELAVCTGSDSKKIEGSISRDLRLPGWERISGGPLIDEVDESFDTQNCVGHHLENIAKVLADVGGPWILNTRSGLPLMFCRVFAF
ncbi:MAG: hypothetical protein ACRCSF_08060 [Mycobacteriaceae bacterium]